LPQLDAPRQDPLLDQILRAISPPKRDYGVWRHELRDASV